MKKIVINYIPKQSTNKTYEGKHWSYRAKNKNELYTLVRLQTKETINEPSNLEYTFYWTGRVLDSDNNSVIGKMITDILTEGKDDYRHILRVSYQSKKSNKSFNYVEIVVESVI